MKPTVIGFAAALALGMAGCAAQLPGQGPSPTVIIGDVAQTAGAEPLRIASARLITDNDEAFRSKLDLIERSSSSLDLIYYIWANDYSSSRLSQALIAAAARGVKVRLLVDYQTNYKRLDLFSYLESAGGGKIEVRFYNRPTRNIVQDAAYMTMGCPRDAATVVGPQDCSQQKFDAIARLFDQEMIAGMPAATKNISNLNTGGSGLFLSGLYSKRPDVMAIAIQRGQGIDPKALAAGKPEASAAERAQLKKLAQAYWYSRTGAPFQRLQGRLRLLFASALFGEKVEPVFATFNNLLPVNREISGSSIYDWDYLTDFTHHKFLLADRRLLQMGGRNVEDSYHMHANELTEKYVFMDTDLVAELSAGGDTMLSESFERLWSFDAMVATLAEVRQHAPNDFVANLAAFEAAERACRGTGRGRSVACIDSEFQRRTRQLDQRIAAEGTAMTARAAKYVRYANTIAAVRPATLAADSGASIAYLENLHFDVAQPPGKRTRVYGAQVGEEAKSGKNIHAVWLDALAGVCARASPAAPQRVVLHNAYFFPPSQMLAALAHVMDGRVDCSNVRITVLTNSIDTTDLNVVNILARHSMKALLDHLAEHGNKARGARFDYYEYRMPESNKALSLHSKVSVLGPDIMVGSANADVRSLMMDTNNAMLLRSAGRMHDEYLKFVDSIVGDAKRSRSVREEMEGKPRAALIEEDMATLDRIAAKYHLERRLGEGELAALRTQLRGLLDAAYELSRRSLDPAMSNSERRDAQQAFNRLFKTI